MVLFHQIIEIFDLADDDGGPVLFIVAMAAAFASLPSMVILSGTPWRWIAWVRKRSAASVSVLREQKVNGLAGLIYRSVQVPPLAFHSDIGLIHPPAASHRALAAVNASSNWELYFTTQRWMVAWSTSTRAPPSVLRHADNSRDTPHTTVHPLEYPVGNGHP